MITPNNIIIQFGQQFHFDQATQKKNLQIQFEILSSRWTNRLCNSHNHSISWSYFLCWENKTFHAIFCVLWNSLSSIEALKLSISEDHHRRLASLRMWAFFVVVLLENDIILIKLSFLFYFLGKKILKKLFCSRYMVICVVSGFGS